MAIEKDYQFADGFEKGLYAQVVKVPENFNFYYFQYPEGIRYLENALKEASEENQKAKRAMAQEIGCGELFRSEKHNIWDRYNNSCETFEEKRDWLCGFWAGVITRKAFETGEKKMTEKEMAYTISEWLREGSGFFKNIGNFEKIATIHNYVLQKGIENCTEELQDVYKAVQRSVEEWVES